MMAEQKQLNTYAVSVFIKPKDDKKNGIRYRGKTFRGIARAENAKQANDITLAEMVKAFSTTETPMTERDMLIKACIPQNDFFFTSEKPDEAEPAVQV